MYRCLCAGSSSPSTVDGQPVSGKDIFLDKEIAVSFILGMLNSIGSPTTISTFLFQSGKGGLLPKK